MSAAPGRGEHWQRPATQPPLTAVAIAAQIGACDARKSPVLDAARDGNSERRKPSPSARSTMSQQQQRSSSPLLASAVAAASGASRGARNGQRANHARSPVGAPRKSPVPSDARNSGRSPPNRPVARTGSNGAMAAETNRGPTQPTNAASSLGSEFLNMSPATCMREINPEIQDVLRADRGLQTEVEQQRECSVYPLMTSSTASFITVDNDSDFSDSDTQTEPLPYVKGNGLVHLEHDRGYTIAEIDHLPDEALEALIAQMSLALDRRKAGSTTSMSGSNSHLKSQLSRSSKPKGATDHQPDKKSHRRQRSDQNQQSNKYMDLEVASITSGGHSGDEHDRWRDKRASGPHDKMFRSQFLLRDPENGHLCHVNYPNRRTVIDGCRQLRRVKPVAVSPNASTPDRGRIALSLASPRSAFDDVSSQNSESSIPPPL